MTKMLHLAWMPPPPGCASWPSACSKQPGGRANRTNKLDHKINFGKLVCTRGFLGVFAGVDKAEYSKYKFVSHSACIHNNYLFNFD